MHINSFLIGGLVFLSLLWIFTIYERTNLLNHNHHNLLNSKESSGLWLRGLYLLLFAIMASMAVSTMNTYIYPTDEKVFRNVDYHVLSHKGYEVGDTFCLAHGYTSEDDGYPAASLWDDKDGMVVLKRNDSCMVIREFVEPLYIRKDTHNSWWQIWKENISRSYHLVNQVIPDDISKGFTLTLNNDTVYSLRIEHIKENRVFYISSVFMPNGSCITDTSTFTRVIQQGYPVLDIIAKSPRIEITEDLEHWFESAYMVRKEIPMDGNIPTFDDDYSAPLCLMPGLSFFMNEELKVNGKTCDFKKTIIVPFSDYANDGKITFFSGLGNKKTEEFRLSYIPDNRMRLELLKPDMKQIMDTLGRVFITSSIDDVSKESLSGGYLYHKFIREDNHNHINGHFQYGAGNARSELSINILDLNDTNDCLPHNYKCNTEFLLHSRDKTPNATSWIFELTNLRETNSLQSQTIVIFILLMFMMVAIRVLSDSFFDRYSLSLSEMAIYVILFSLCVVRLIVGWRASTFVPIGEITLPMFLKMRSSILDYCTWMVACLPLLVTLSVEIWKRYNVSISQSLLNKLENTWGGLISFGVVLLLCLVARDYPSLNRLCNIPLPITSYFILEIWLNRLRENGIKGTKLCRIVAFVVIIGYLFKADAGFVIIFLSYMMVHYLMLGCMFWKLKVPHKHQILRYSLYLLSILSATILFLVLRFEGKIMIFLFRYVDWLMVAISLLLLFGVLVLLYQRKEWVAHKKLNMCYRWASCGLCTLLLTVCLLDAMQVSLPFPTITSVLNSKAHMRYRAEVQSLGQNEKIDDLIQRCDFDSNDITYIMRSAHNQWFINQYIHAGQKLEKNGEYFHIQPHSNQGATYTTQTTDLVVTRYLLAEHGENVVRYILFLWMMLILIFVLEFKMSNSTNRIFLNGPILIYIISLMVYLSATNRIVFVGQDIPVISLQSRVAILFPLFLLSLLLGRSLYLRSNEDKKGTIDICEIVIRGLIFASILFLFTLGCISGIEQKGKDQEDTQFNVSRLISDLSIKVDNINERFSVFQEINEKGLRRKPVKEVWEMFTNNEDKVYTDFLTQDDFFSSLLHYFNEKQTSKTDVNQLLHLRRRGGKCYLALNKQHYFIPAIMNEEARWTGNVYAARVASEMMLFENNKKKIVIDKDKSYEKNILIPQIQSQIPNMPLMRFDKDWTPDNKPLFLISSKQGQSYSEFFNIGADTMEIRGDGKRNQVATAVLPGDFLSLYKKNPTKKNAETVLNGNMTNDGTPYLVRNMWLNGHKHLFFPLGKQSMWTYHLGNLVSDVFSKDNVLKDTSLYLSLDFELMKAFYNNINNQINKRVYPPNKVLAILSDFNEKGFKQQCNINNNLYYDEKKKELKIKLGKADINHQKAAELVNRELKKVRYLENPLPKALNNVLRAQYDFTAVAIDGEGHIRALFDYSRNRHLDPNNVSHLNKVISELYTEGSNADERDIFGSKALQYIPSGPGSSFKPIVYTSITSQKNLNWESIDVTDIGQKEARSNQNVTESGSIPYAYYGGISAPEKGLNIQGGKINHDEYLVWSNNLYHSVIFLLGMQNYSSVRNVMRPYTDDIEKKKAFPVFTYDGMKMCFNPSVWHKTILFDGKDLMTLGLLYNFHIVDFAPRLLESYTHLFGDNILVQAIYNNGNSSRVWVFPEMSSINTADRNQPPSLRIGFNRILLGSDPLQLTPLQMAVNASRLVSLNRAENLVTILDEDSVGDYQFFNIGYQNGWSEQNYLDFVKRQVWAQLRQVPKRGTAQKLNDLANKMESGKYGQHYYLYCKTGTLEDERQGSSKNDRMKHLLVIITNSPLEQVNNVSDLRKIRYYALYLSYLGISRNDFDMNVFRPYIEDVLNSSSFKNYMRTKN